MNNEQKAKFEDVAKSIMQMISDVRFEMDLLETDLSKMMEDPDNCESHTGAEHQIELSVVINTVTTIFDFYVLLRTYHALSEHRRELNPFALSLMHDQADKLERLFAVYKVERAKWEKEQAAAEETPIPKGTMNQDNWLTQLFKGLNGGTNDTGPDANN